MTLKQEEVFQFMKKFGAEFINYNNELIIDLDYNIYFSLNNCHSIADVEASTLLALCRPIGKGIRYKKRKWRDLLKRFNSYFNCELTREDMREIYGELCYSGMLKVTSQFIEEGFQMDQLQKYARMRKKVLLNEADLY
ncbi:hypothetical protein [Kurthia gibsonii]|uniref:hypothetical protein n=1 Tax=Kurthia gibsonii TaxID=33946 RepID=UPI0031B6E327